MFRIIVSAVIAVVLVVAGWSGYWVFMNERLNSKLDRLAGKYGLELSCLSRQTTGYPFDFHITCDNPRLAGTRADRFELIAPRVTIHIRALDLSRMGIVFEGPVKAEFQQTVAGQVQTQRTSFQIHVSRVPVTIVLASRRAPDVAVRVENFRASLTRWLAQKPVQTLRVSGRRLRGALSADGPADAALIDFTATALTVRLDPPPASGFDLTRVAAARLHARADKAAAWRGKTMPERLKNWQRAGGRLHQVAFDISSDQLGLDGKGAVALDSNGRVNGRLATGITGLNRLLARLVEANALKRKSAILVRAVGDLLSDNSAADGVKQVRLPLRFKRGKVYFGPIRIGRMPAVF